MKIEIPEIALVLIKGVSGNKQSNLMEWVKNNFRGDELICMINVEDLFKNLKGEKANNFKLRLINNILSSRLEKRLTTVVDVSNCSKTNQNELIKISRRFHIPQVTILFDLKYMDSDIRENKIQHNEFHQIYKIYNREELKSLIVERKPL